MGKGGLEISIVWVLLSPLSPINVIFSFMQWTLYITNTITCQKGVSYEKVPILMAKCN